MVQVVRGTVEEQVIRLLMEVYHREIAAIARELHLSRKMVEKTVNALRRRNVVAVDRTEDGLFIRLIRTDIEFVGRNPTQRRALKRKGRHRQPERGKAAPPDIMYA